MNLYGFVENDSINAWDYLGWLNTEGGVPEIVIKGKPKAISGGVRHVLDLDIGPGSSSGKLDGILVQKVTIEFEIYACEEDEDGKKFLKRVEEFAYANSREDIKINSGNNPYVYWEAWFVHRGKVQADDRGGNQDEFNLSKSNLKGLPRPSCGRVTQTGEMTFYQGVSMPDSMKPGNVSMAGILHSTSIDPAERLKMDSAQGPRAGASRETTIRWNQIGELCKEKVGIDGGNRFESSAYPISRIK